MQFDNFFIHCGQIFKTNKVMGILIDNRYTKSVYTDRENNHYAENDKITKLICDNEDSIINIICKLVFGDKVIKKEIYNFLVTLYTCCIVNKKNELHKKTILEFISKRNNISVRTLERYIDKLVSIGILISKCGTISFTKYYNPVNIKYPNTDFIIIETNPHKTSNKIELL